MHSSFTIFKNQPDLGGEWLLKWKLQDTLKRP